MSSLWYLLVIAAVGGGLGLALLIAWLTRGWPRPEPKPKRWPRG
jgi:hypothetical protein